MKKKPKSKSRNPFAIPAKSRTSGGPMRPKKNKRKKTPKSQIEEIEKEYDELS